MNLFEIILLAIALSIDACAVSFAYGLGFKTQRFKNSLLLAVFCGGFQGLMPIIGYFLLTPFINTAEPYAKWIVFTIFLCLGLNFIKDAIKNEIEEVSCLSLKCLFTVAFATSIDALAAGAGIALERVSIILPAIIIAVITFINSLAGFWTGNCLRKFPSRFLKLTAAVILILLAFKALY